MPLPDSWAIADVIAKMTAVVIGGSWAVYSLIRRREGVPRANIRQKFTIVELDHKQRIVRIEVMVENIGESLLRVRSMTNWLQQILPLANTASGIFEPKKTTSSNPEIEWPTLGTFQHYFKLGEREIEPGESDVFPFDYFIPNDVTTVQAYSYITNPSKWYVRWRRPNRPTEIGWQATDIFTLPVPAPRPQQEVTHSTLDSDATKIADGKRR